MMNTNKPLGKIARWRDVAVLALFSLLLLAGCGTDTHVSGRVTDTADTTVYCGKSPCTHHSFVVNGHEYQDDWDDVRTGDYVSFDYNSVWGVSNLTDSTQHHDDYTWLWIVLGLIGVGGIVWLIYWLHSID